MNKVIGDLIIPSKTTKVVSDSCTHIFTHKKLDYIVSIAPLESLTNAHAREPSPFTTPRNKIRKFLTICAISENDEKDEDW